jgi:hypothetical protein
MHPKFTLAGAALLLTGGACAVAAGEQQTQRLFDATIERATAQRAAERIGELRGTIGDARHADALVTGAIGDDRAKSAPGNSSAIAGDGQLRLVPKNGPRIRLMLVPAPAFRKLPPIVDNANPPEGVDRVLTGSIGRADRVSLLDLDEPMRHLPSWASRTE